MSSSTRSAILKSCNIDSTKNSIKFWDTSITGPVRTPKNKFLIDSADLSKTFTISPKAQEETAYLDNGDNS